MITLDIMLENFAVTARSAERKNIGNIMMGGRCEMRNNQMGW